MIENIAAKYDRGLKKEQQEDKAFAEEIKTSGSSITAILMIADGWGSNLGEVPLPDKVELILKDLFVSNFYKKLAEKNNILFKNLKDVLNLAFFFIDAQLKNGNHINSSKERGTTCTVALILKSPLEFTNVIIGHVGDSRAYVISQKKIKLLTHDDSLVWQYYDQGKISYKDIPKHIDRHFLTQALGCGTLSRPQIIQTQIKNDETLLLCSDGLYENVSEKKIKNIVNSTIGLSETCDKLISLANKKGGTDNISVSIFSKSTHKKRKSWIPLIILMGILLIAATFGRNFIFNFFNENANTKNDIVNEKNSLAQNNLKVLVNKSEKIIAGDFDIYVPTNVSFKNKDNVYVRVSYNGKLKNKFFILKIKSSQIPVINEFKFNEKVSTRLRFPDSGRYQVDLSVYKDNSELIFNRKYDVFIKRAEIEKPIIKLTVLTLKILNYDSIRDEIISINWMEGANDIFQPPTEKHVYQSSKVIPNNIKIRFKNGSVEDYKVR